MDAATFESLVSGVQSLVVSLAVIIGGVWTLVTFKVLGNVRRARAELADLQRRLKEQAVLEMTIQLSEQTIPGDGHPYLKAVVVIRNHGNRNARLAYDDGEPFAITPLTIGVDGKQSYGDSLVFPVVRASNPSRRAPATHVRAGGTERIPFLVRLPGPGAYFVAFRTGVSDEEREVALEAGSPTGRRLRWVAKEYFVARAVAT